MDVRGVTHFEAIAELSHGNLLPYQPMESASMHHEGVISSA